MTRPGHHKCPVPSCGKQVQATHLMCAGHWSKIPRHIQTAIYREYYGGLRRKEHPTREYAEQVRLALDHIALINAPVAAK